ncbi:MAG: class I fructose-bisphosphate aldolase [Alphaproteobacteria bacterium]|nr:class I fructose-bisphosphate aldolase [Alphaproteobacteria bacterium]
MKTTKTVDALLANYESDNEKTRENIAKMLMQGKPGGTGRMVILPIDQGFEHGPARSFAINPAAYDPHWQFKLGIESGCSAFAAPLGTLEAGYKTFKGQIPTILKCNHANSLSRQKENADQAVVGTVEDAVRLGCSAIGFTIYPGSDACYAQMEEFAALSREAKAAGLATVLWVYPRGGTLSKDGETALDVVSYGAHMGCLMGAHIIKVKLPTAHLELGEAKKVYEQYAIPRDTLTQRVSDVVKSCFDGRRIVVFSGGASKGTNEVLDEARAIRDGGGHGSIMGRNAFQRPWDESLKLLSDIMEIYKA